MPYETVQECEISGKKIRVGDAAKYAGGKVIEVVEIRKTSSRRFELWGYPLISSLPGHKMAGNEMACSLHGVEDDPTPIRTQALRYFNPIKGGIVDTKSIIKTNNIAEDSWAPPTSGCIVTRWEYLRTWKTKADRDLGRDFNHESPKIQVLSERQCTPKWSLIADDKRMAYRGYLPKTRPKSEAIIGKCFFSFEYCYLHNFLLFSKWFPSSTPFLPE